MVTEEVQRNGTPLKKWTLIPIVQMNSTKKQDNHGLPVQTKEIKSLTPITSTSVKMRYMKTMDGKGRAFIRNYCMIRNTNTKWKEILQIIIMVMDLVMDSSKQKWIPNGGTMEMEEEPKSGMPLKKLLDSAIIRHISMSKQDSLGLVV